MGGIVLVVGLIGVIAALASAGRGEAPPAAMLPAATPPPLPPLPGQMESMPSFPQAPPVESPIIERTVEAIKEGTATPELLSAAIEDAKAKEMPETQQILTDHLDKMLGQEDLGIIAQPDRPGSPIPLDKATGKTLWYVEVKSGIKMVLPRFPQILEIFKALQSVIGVKTDGRIGPKTLAAFQKWASGHGFTRIPTTIETLAANADKWTQVIRRDLAPDRVGWIPSPFDDIEEEDWSTFLESINQDWPEFAEHVRSKLGKFVETEIKLPEGENARVTFSGVLALARSAGLRGAEKWLSDEGDRKKFPHSTRVFLAANGIF